MPASRRDRRRVVRQAFKASWEAKDIDALVGPVDPSGTAVADGGGPATSFLRPIEGAEQVARAWVEIAHRAPAEIAFVERIVDGQPGVDR